MTAVPSLSTRLGRWLLASVAITLAAWALAGSWRLPMLDAYLIGVAIFLLVASLVLDPDLMRERLRPGQPGLDPRRLVWIRVLVLTHYVVALLDVGRAHVTDRVPRQLQAAALAVVAAAAAWVLWAMSVNRFFVPAIRIQPERHHRLVTTGPYAIVRHPGYMGMVLLMPASALALGSWAALVPALAVSILFVQRTSAEDLFLQERLEGYGRYAGTVRWRLFPGIW